MNLFRILGLTSLLLPIGGNAQQIAIIDQGLNTTMLNQGEHQPSLCYDNGNADIWFANQGAFPVAGGNTFPDIRDGDQVAMTTVSLCHTSHFGEKTNSATLPVYRSLPDKNKYSQPYKRAALALNGLIPKVEFDAPFQQIPFGRSLRHGTDVANAAYEFDNSVEFKMVQVFHIDDRKSSSTDCSANPARTISQNTAVIGNIGKILSAFQDIAQNPDGVDVINMSIVMRQSYCARQAGDLEPDLCEQQIGQQEVFELERMGIPLVVGLANSDLEPEEITWPACLSGVIKVGAENDNDNVPNGGIGIGAMDVDFFANNEVSANRVNGNKLAGNSFAAPKVAAAYALLKHAVPNSTVSQRTQALIQANSRMNTYRFNGQDYRRRHLKQTDIANAIQELQQLVRGNLDNIFFEDANEYGAIFAVNASNYSFDIDFNNLIASKKSGLKSSVPSTRDVVLSFEAKMGTSGFESNGFKIFVNGVQRDAVNFFNGERHLSFTLDREYFTQGANTIRIDPQFPTRPWGIKNIKADFTDPIALTVNQIDRTQYGSEETPPRPSGLRATFDLDNSNNDVLFYVTGWGVRTSDEVDAYFNGAHIGNLHQGNPNFDDFSPQNAFTLPRADLLVGNNVIEFVRKDGGGAWGVSNMLLASTSLSPSLTLGTRDTNQYGNNYGSNEHPVSLSVRFTPRAEHDHKLQWQGFDIDNNTEVDVYLNDTFIKTMAVTGNNATGNTESILLASRLFETGENTLSFLTNSDGVDTTWGITNLLVRTSTIINLDDDTNLSQDYGYYARFGITPTDWTRTYSNQEYQTRLYATFTSSATSDKIVNVTGWDIDHADELAVYINDVFLQYVSHASASSIYSTPDAILIPKALLTPGTNTISFRSKNHLAGFQSEKWGIFFGEADGSNLTPVILLLLE